MSSATSNNDPMSLSTVETVSDEAHIHNRPKGQGEDTVVITERVDGDGDGDAGEAHVGSVDSGAVKRLRKLMEDGKAL